MVGGMGGEGGRVFADRVKDRYPNNQVARYKTRMGLSDGRPPYTTLLVLPPHTHLLFLPPCPRPPAPFCTDDDEQAMADRRKSAALASASASASAGSAPAGPEGLRHRVVQFTRPAAIEEVSPNQARVWI